MMILAHLDHLIRINLVVILHLVAIKILILVFILIFDGLLFGKIDMAWQAKFASALGLGLVGLFVFKMVGIASLRALKQ